MKESRYWDIMKHLKLFIIGLCLNLIAYGCSGGGVSGDIGYIPLISDIKMMNVNDSASPFFASTFEVGDLANFNIAAEDDDLNMITLSATIYDQTNLENPFEGPISLELPKQTSQIMTYNLIYPIQITEPAGNYTISFQIKDKKGNISRDFSINFKVN